MIRLWGRRLPLIGLAVYLAGAFVALDLAWVVGASGFDRLVAIGFTVWATHKSIAEGWVL